MRTTTSRHLVFALVAFAGVAAFLATHPGIAPAGGSPLTVNSTANTSDGTCDVTSCTLREAIEDVNDDVSDVITFDAGVFPASSPAVIDLESGDGELPIITSDVTIDVTGAGAVLDGDGNDDETMVATALTVNGSQNGFSFELLGDDNFTIRDFTDAITVLGMTFSADVLAYDGISLTDIVDDGITMREFPFATSISLTNSHIETGDAGIVAAPTGPDIQTFTYEVTGNHIEAGLAETAGPAVALNVQTALASGASATFTVDDNEHIETLGDNAIRVTYCGADECALDNAQILVSVSGNEEVAGSGNDAVVGRIDADDESSIDGLVEFFINDNSSITAAGDAIDISSNICCGSDNRQVFEVNGNGPITTTSPGGGDAVDIEATSCCDAGSGTSIEVNQNTGGMSAAEGNAVQLALLCCGENSIDIRDNAGAISSGDDNSINIIACVEDESEIAEDEADCIANATTLLNITGNTLTESVEDGIHICCGVFQRDDTRSVIANNTIEGHQDDGIELNSVSGITVGPGNVIAGNGDPGDDDVNGIEVSNVTAIDFFTLFAAELPTSGNTITQNEIHGNTNLGIDLVGYANGASEFAIIGCLPFSGADINPNDCLGSPIVTGVADDVASGTGCAGCLVEVFLANQEPQDQPPPPPPPAPAGAEAQHGEGATFLGAGIVANDGTFSIELPCGLSAGLLTATQTNEEGSTSEFSENVAFSGTSSVDCTPTPTTGTPATTQPTTPAPTTPAPTTPSPTTPAATPTPTATFDQLPCGDVDGNLSINSIDAALVLQYGAGLIQTLTVPERADVNGDGDINAIDAALILQNTAGLLDELDC